MPKSCVAVNCTNHNMKSGPEGKKISFHVFPKDKERRDRWICAIKRINEDKSRWSPSKHAVLCGEHFIEGKPNGDPDHPDYVPSIFTHDRRPSHSHETSTKKIRRFAAVKRRHVRKKLLLEEPASKVQVTSTEVMDEPIANTTCQNLSSEISESERFLFLDDMNNLRMERDAAINKCKQYEDKMKALKMTAASVAENDTKCVFYTGLTWTIFFTTHQFLQKYNTSQSRILSIDQLFITLVKLRFDVPFQFLADRTGLSETTIIKFFWMWIEMMYSKMSFLIMCPDREAITQTLPAHFKDKFPRLTTIIDCFEIFIDRPKNLKARACTYSNYKKHTTVKFLIGCTPLGHISFLSKAWGGRVSDTEIVKQSGFMDSSRHFPGDEILADRGFTVQDEMAVECGAHLILPSFTKGKKQLSPKDVEISRKIASVRIHIERIIGLIKNKYAILQGTLPIKVIKSVKDEANDLNFSNIDQIVTVCAALVNLGEGIVVEKDSQVENN